MGERSQSVAAGNAEGGPPPLGDAVSGVASIAANVAAGEDKGKEGSGGVAPSGVAALVPQPPSTPLSLATPRHVALRSKVLMHRTPQGVKAALPPPELLQAGDLNVVSVASVQGMSGGFCQRSTHHVGEGSLRVPIEMVTLPRTPGPGSKAKSSLMAIRKPTVRVAALAGGAAADVQALSLARPQTSGAAEPSGGLTGTSPSLPSSAAALQRPKTSYSSRWVCPELSKELHGEIRKRMNNLEAACKVADLMSNPRAVQYFFKELQELLQLLQFPEAERSYRASYNFSTLTAFMREMPKEIGQDLPPSGDLPATGFMASTLVTTFAEIPWKFRYNSLTHKVCDCPSIFIGLQRGECLVPEDVGGKLQGKVTNDAIAAAREKATSGIITQIIEPRQMTTDKGALSTRPAPAWNANAAGHPRQPAETGKTHVGSAGPALPPHSAASGGVHGKGSSHAGERTSGGSQSKSLEIAGIGRIGNVSPAAVEARVEALRRGERHLPPRLLDLAKVVRDRFEAFTEQILPSLVEDFQALPLRKGRAGHFGSSAWERFVSRFKSEVGMLEMVYIQFETLFLDMANRMIGSALDPVQRLAAPSLALVRAPADPFSEVQASVLCQRLGLLKRRVNFGGPYNIVEFDPAVLLKARRILQMNGYYDEVRVMAQDLLTRFQALCRVLEELRSSQLDPELCANADLRSSVLALEEVWAGCSLVLQQDSLEFVAQLLFLVPGLTPGVRWLLGAAMNAKTLDDAVSVAQGLVQENGRVLSDRQVQQELQDACRAMLFETLPIRVYMDEVWNEICAERATQAAAETVALENGTLALPAPASAASLSPSPTHLQLRNPSSMSIRSSYSEADHDPKEPAGVQPSKFRELFCTKDDRHKQLRRHFVKFTEEKYERFLKFITDELRADEVAGAHQAKNILDIHKTLREVTVFSAEQSPADALVAGTSAEERPDAHCQKEEVIKNSSDRRQSTDEIQAGSQEGFDPDEFLTERERKQQRQIREMKRKACARWVCLQQVLQQVKPKLFPKEPPEELLGKWTSQGLRLQFRKGEVWVEPKVAAKSTGKRAAPALLPGMSAAAGANDDAGGLDGAVGRRMSSNRGKRDSLGLLPLVPEDQSLTPQRPTSTGKRSSTTGATQQSPLESSSL
eukprot:TRINITY_DN19130_c0_g1_i1.p1 TRINITY_DN19130_c0_g1~~TRINITY_DN19130_c0_g1_i1.p1  ORF type:complete len:1143 (+),score=303.18 TRINITY_DN19130_c0_g1_i1:261-3689(+)